jgi:uncharacterized membrane protein
MFSLALIFAILAGISAATYGTFQKFGSNSINPALGAMIISLVAFLINLFVLIGMKFNGQEVLYTNKGLILLMLAGVGAAGIDLFTLLAFSHGWKITSAPVINAVSFSILLIIGFLILKEPFNLGRVTGLVLIIVGILILQKFGF